MKKISFFPKTGQELKTILPGARMWAVGLENAMFTYFELEPDTIFPEHSHEAEQITMVLEGELIFVYEGCKVTMGPGDVIAVPSNAVHSVYTGKGRCVAVDAWSPVREEYLRSGGAT